MNTFSTFERLLLSQVIQGKWEKGKVFYLHVAGESHTCQFPTARSTVALLHKHAQNPLSCLDGRLINHNLLVACLFSFRKVSSEDEIRSLRLNSISKMGFFPKIIKARNRANFAVIPLIW